MPQAYDFEISECEDNQLEDFLGNYTEEPKEAVKYGKRFDELTKSLKELEEIGKECSRENWDGMNEPPLKQETIIKARLLLIKSADLPYEIPLPFLTSSSSGLIEIEWYKEKDHRFAIRLNDQGIFIYSGLFGPIKDLNGSEILDDIHGTSGFNGEIFPEVIKTNLSRLFETQIN
ncbi:MAG: hypothetical protein WD032_00105 [Nitrospirales bacterium]